MTRIRRRRLSKIEEKEQRIIKQQLSQIKGGAGATEYIILLP